MASNAAGLVVNSVLMTDLVGLGAEVGRGRTRLGEVAAEDGVDEGAEDNLGSTEGIDLYQHTPGLVSRDMDHVTYPVCGRASHSTKTNLKV